MVELDTDYIDFDEEEKDQKKNKEIVGIKGG